MTRREARATALWIVISGSRDMIEHHPDLDDMTEAEKKKVFSEFDVLLKALTKRYYKLTDQGAK